MNRGELPLLALQPQAAFGLLLLDALALLVGTATSSSALLPLDQRVPGRTVTYAGHTVRTVAFAARQTADSPAQRSSGRLSA